MYFRNHFRSIIYKSWILTEKIKAEFKRYVIQKFEFEYVFKKKMIKIY